ncbi:MAG TPA: hypothetical protein VG370_29335 [Chloroflexota bacterium]|nr:hypothetical protein [Chloroflexota bacterium]
MTSTVLCPHCARPMRPLQRADRPRPLRVLVLWCASCSRIAEVPVY